MILVYIALGVAQYFILKRHGKRYGAIIPVVSLIMSFVVPIMLYMFTTTTITMQEWPSGDSMMPGFDDSFMNPGLPSMSKFGPLIILSLLQYLVAPIIYVIMIFVVKGPEAEYHQPFKGSFHNTSQPKEDVESVDSMNVHDL